MHAFDVPYGQLNMEGIRVIKSTCKQDIIFPLEIKLVLWLCDYFLTSILTMWLFCLPIPDMFPHMKVITLKVCNWFFSHGNYRNDSLVIYCSKQFLFIAFIVRKYVIDFPLIVATQNIIMHIIQNLDIIQKNLHS